jgi:hypothetical protein
VIRPTTREQEDQIADSDTITVLAQARDSSSSLLWLRDAESTRTVTSIASENMDALDRTFDFDELVITSKVYRSTLASFLRERIEGDRMKLVRQMDNNANTVIQPDSAYLPETSEKTPFTIDTDFSWLRIGPDNLALDEEGSIPTADNNVIGSAISKYQNAAPEGNTEAQDKSEDTIIISRSNSTETNNDGLAESSPEVADDDIVKEDIDFDFVYAQVTFMAIVEGQANVTKGDKLILLDDSNSYWWLVKVVKDITIGYLPAEIVETPVERLARLNRQKNADLSDSHLIDVVGKAKKQRIVDKIGRRTWKKAKRKTVVFGNSAYIDTPIYSDSKPEGDGSYEEEHDSILNGHDV